jgi:PIN domain nuclease of toxin-antitoxin system
MRKRRVNRIVLDSAAVLAMIQGEPGGERVEALLDAAELGADVQVAISSVNWCEILTRTQRDNNGMTSEELSAALAGVKLIPFDKAAAELAAGYALVSQALSLGDRACLALAKINHATAWTADRVWIQFKLDVPVELIRG